MLPICQKSCPVPPPVPSGTSFHAPSILTVAPCEHFKMCCRQWNDLPLIASIIVQSYNWMIAPLNHFGFNVGVFIWTRKEIPPPPNSPFAVFQAGYRSPLWLSYWMISPVCYRGYSTHCATASVNSLLWVRGVNFSEQRFELKPSHLRSPPPSPVSFQILLFHTASSGLDYGTAHEFAIKIDPSYFLISSSRRETASSLPRNIWVKQ